MCCYWVRIKLFYLEFFKRLGCLFLVKLNLIVFNVIFVVGLIFLGLVPINFFMTFRKRKMLELQFFFLQIVDMVSGY